MKKIAVVLIFVALSLTIAVPAYAADPPAKGGRDHSSTLGVVFVNGQNLYYDTFVTVVPLRWNGHNQNSFQQLYDGTTDFGPGDPGYRGGRWWIDNGDPEDGAIENQQDEYDTYVLCPLLAPGRAEP